MQAELVNVLSDKSPEAYQKTKPIIQEIAEGNKQTIKIAITVIRNILQTDKHKVHIKLNAMRFLRDSYQTANKSFLKATVDYILPHLKTIAVHSVDSSKYDQYAEKQYIDKEDLVKFKSYIQSLFTLNAQCIKNWADWQDTVQPSSKNPWQELKVELENKKILFPIQDQYFKEKNKDAFISNYRKAKADSKTQLKADIKEQKTSSKTLKSEPMKEEPRRQTVPQESKTVVQSVQLPKVIQSAVATVKKPNYSDNIRRIVTRLREMGEAECDESTTEQLKQLEQEFEKALDDYANFETNFDQPFINQSYQAFQVACQKIKDKLKNMKTRVQTSNKGSSALGSKQPHAQKLNDQLKNLPERVTFRQSQQEMEQSHDNIKVNRVTVTGTIVEEQQNQKSAFFGMEQPKPQQIKAQQIKTQEIKVQQMKPPKIQVVPPTVEPTRQMTAVPPKSLLSQASLSSATKQDIQQVESQVLRLLQEKQRMLEQALRIKTRIEQAGATKLHREIQLEKQELMRLNEEIENTRIKIDMSNQVVVSQPPPQQTSVSSVPTQWRRIQSPPSLSMSASEQQMFKKCIFKLGTQINQHTFLEKYDLVSKPNKQHYVHMRLSVGCHKGQTVRACRIENTPQYNVWKKPPEHDPSSGRVTQEIIVSVDKIPRGTVCLHVETDARDVIVQLPVMLMSFLKAGQVDSMDLVKAFQMYDKRAHRSKILKMDSTLIDNPSTLRAILDGDIVTTRNNGTMVNTAYLYEPYNILLLVSVELLSNQRIVIKTLELDDKHDDAYSKELLKNLAFLLGCN